VVTWIRRSECPLEQANESILTFGLLEYRSNSEWLSTVPDDVDAIVVQAHVEALVSETGHRNVAIIVTHAPANLVYCSR